MITSNPISTISYNTEDFLISRCEYLLRKRVLTFYMLINHKAEEDESKEHFHVYFELNGKTCVDEFYDLFTQFVEGEPLPRKVMPFRKSKFDDAYLYFSHDTSYLASKCQTRKYHYDFKDFIFSDLDFAIEYIHLVDRSKYDKTLRFIEYADSGLPFEELVRIGVVPVNQFFQYRDLYSMINAGKHTYRNGRDNHEDFLFLEGE